MQYYNAETQRYNLRGKKMSNEVPGGNGSYYLTADVPTFYTCFCGKRFPVIIIYIYLYHYFCIYIEHFIPFSKLLLKKYRRIISTVETIDAFVSTLRLMFRNKSVMKN